MNINRLNLIFELIDTHVDKVHDFIFKTSDIIKIMSFITDEMNKLDKEAKAIVDNLDGSLFFLLTINDSFDRIKYLESCILKSIHKKAEDINQDFKIYLNELSEKRIINNLDKSNLICYTKLFMYITYINSYTNYLIKRIDDYKSKKYRK